MFDNPLEDTTARQQLIRKRAYHLWEADGCPDGQADEFWERARELVGIAGGRSEPDADRGGGFDSGEPWRVSGSAERSGGEGADAIQGEPTANVASKQSFFSKKDCFLPSD